jgi:hypothetical protein
VTAKEKLHRVVDELSENEAEETLRYLAARRDQDDPLLALLERAPEDDEPSSAEEDASAREAWSEYRRGESAPLEQVRREAS